MLRPASLKIFHVCPRPPRPPQLFDRLAKGMREAPSKALMGQLAEAGGDDPAAAFALRQSLATLGALGGSLAASAALRASGYNYALVFGLAWVPAAAALALLAAAFGSWGRPPGQMQGEGRPWDSWRLANCTHGQLLLMPTRVGMVIRISSCGCLSDQQEEDQLEPACS